MSKKWSPIWDYSQVGEDSESSFPFVLHQFLKVEKHPRIY